MRLAKRAAMESVGAIGYWLLVIGYWLLAIGVKCKGKNYENRYFDCVS